MHDTEWLEEEEEEEEAQRGAVCDTREVSFVRGLRLQSSPESIPTYRRFRDTMLPKFKFPTGSVSANFLRRQWQHYVCHVRRFSEVEARYRKTREPTFSAPLLDAAPRHWRCPEKMAVRVETRTMVATES